MLKSTTLLKTPRQESFSNDLVGLIQDLGLPLSKAGWLVAQMWPMGVDFPLHAELLAAVPKEFPGSLPDSEQALNEALAEA
jgi:hypothetical protein